MSATAKPPEVGPPEPEDEGFAQDAHGLHLTRRTLLLFVVFAVAAVAFLYFVLPQLAGLEETWNRIDEGNPWWLALALAATVLMFGGYVLLFQGVFVRAESTRTPIDLGVSYQITMASLAATRLFGAGGAGGLVLTAWALRRSGMAPRTVADKTLAFLVLTYAVYTGAMVVVGVGLRVGLFPGPAPFALTVVPAIVAGICITIALLLSRVPPDLQRRLEGFAQRQGRVGRIGQRLANAPAAFSAGIREAICHVRTRDPALVGAIGFWFFQIVVLYASFRAFGAAPPLAVIVMAFFVGMLGNLLPLPGGIGGVDGGMIGAFVAFGVGFGPAAVAVLVYRGFAFWLPTIPGAIAYLQLRRTVHRWDERRDAGLAVA